ncbi:MULTISPECIES: BTAD domain-containing putative transcriptional regulator [unclassified Nocardia]|uniref:AfsR/SARP family transcriptional regulator n=1 Tax=unclassified Nocardia TaxID=2637762 RepID=UPI001CE43591|nr:MULTISPECIES: BTAD domain-containing putative transcriptional regulator [unclassified Nocardia]
MRFVVLGEVQGWRGEAPLDLGPPQRRAVLAVLLLRVGKAVAAAELVEAIWGDQPVPRAIAALRTHVAQLRRALEPDRAARGRSTLLVSVGDGYALRIPPESIDVAEVERLVAAAQRLRPSDPAAARDALVAALSAWRGPALSGLPGPFAERQRSRLEQWRLAILEDRLALDIEIGRDAEAVTELGPLIEVYPLRERFRALLMTALYHSGRQAEALDAYAHARRALVEGIGVEPGPELTAVHEKILRAEMPAPGTPSRQAEPPPAQLPPDIADFTGREDIVEALAAQLTDDGGAVAISAVGGMGGVGKTALALHVAHSIRDHFPDGQLYVNLHGVDPVPTPPGDAVGGFLRALGVPEGDIPPSVDERAALLRTRLSGKRMLLLLDNARDSAQLAPLLAGTPGTAVLITSRSTLTELPAVRRTRLDVLAADEALTLLTRILGAQRVAAEADAARAIVAHCGYLPLAVRIVGARLAVRPRWTIESFANRLADERGRLALLRTGELGVEAAFRLGYGQLNAKQAKAFRTLALAEVPDLPVEGVAAMLDVAVDEAEQVCESLVDLSLLETTTPGRYRFHDLLRLFAREVADEDESDVLVRLLGYYLASVKNLLGVIDFSNTTRLLVPTAVPGRAFTDGSYGQAWNDTERPVVIALHKQAARIGGQALAVAADLAWVMAELMDVGTAARELAGALESLLDAAVRAGNPAIERRIRVALGAILQVGLGEVAASLRHLRGVARLPVRDDADRRLSVLTDILLAIAERRLGNIDASRAHFADALRLAGVLGDRSMTALLLALVTRTHCEAGQYDDAMATAEQAIALARETSNPVALGWALHEYAATMSMRGEHVRAIELGTEAVRTAQRNGVRLWEGWARTRLAQVYLQAGELTKAEEQADAALRLLAKAADPIDRARAMALRAIVLSRRGLIGPAEREFREAAEIFQRAGLTPPTIGSLFSAGSPSSTPK